MGFVKKALKATLPHAIVRRYQKRHEIRPADAPLDDNKIAVISAYDTKYTDRVHESIKEAGYQSSTRASDARYIWLHWYENGVLDYEKFSHKIATINIWKRQGRKIIFHIHNKKPHESRVPNVSHALMTTLADTTDHVSIMSMQSKTVLKNMWYFGNDFSNVSMVQHPNYINVYGDQLDPPLDLTDETLRILFFGQVRPYKGIEKLLEATSKLKNVEVSVFGEPKDKKYATKLKEACKGRGNVRFRLEHIPDKDIPKIFAAHHIVALPYSLESSLNSGAAILALSYGRTVVGTNNGTLEELGDGNLYFGYDYKNDADHVKQLEKSIRAIQAKYDGKYNDLLKVGNAAFKLVEKNNSVKAVANAIKAMIHYIA